MAPRPLCPSPGHGLHRGSSHQCVSSTTHNSPRAETTHMPGAWVNTMWSLQTVDYCSGLNSDEVLIHAPTWMNLENII